MKELTLYLVTGRYDFDDESFLNVIKIACENGVTLVQLREKEASTHDFYRLAQKVKELTDRFDVPLIINDRVDICLAVDAAGVHIGDDELPITVVRNLIGKDKLLGVSAKDVDRAKEAEEAGADYLGVGAIYLTKTKDDPQPTSIETLKKIVSAVDIPVVAIGGLKEANIDSLRHTGIAGISVVSELMLTEDVAQKAQRLRALTEEIVASHN
ncbi:thiamine phosphate synthase [Marinilactibacillus kalidii]|uniref:thiamine phosphate synthase n=1 Tax=Marinilactibacillus kalidii TaxID=2820274 RepID=UPI001ABE6028|nr:thiamine phosphate synthase [Marinilactibacillus kalidii]